VPWDHTLWGDDVVEDFGDQPRLEFTVPALNISAGVNGAYRLNITSDTLVRDPLLPPPASD
jgi:hypothetical protein